jgi:hypothetical protein
LRFDVQASRHRQIGTKRVVEVALLPLNDVLGQVGRAPAVEDGALFISAAAVPPHRPATGRPPDSLQK